MHHLLAWCAATLAIHLGAAHELVPARVFPPARRSIVRSESPAPVDGWQIAAQKMVDRGEATTVEEARSALARRGAHANAQKLVDRGEAATQAEAYAAGWGRRRLHPSQLRTATGDRTEWG